jgi:hypothetical protein
MKHPSLIPSCFFFGHCFVQNLTTSLCILIVIMKKQLELVVFFQQLSVINSNINTRIIVANALSFIARCIICSTLIAFNTKSKY